MQLLNPIILGLASALVMAPNAVAQGGDPEVTVDHAPVWMCKEQNWVNCINYAFEMKVCRNFSDDPGDDLVSWKKAISSFGPDQYSTGGADFKCTIFAEPDCHGISINVVYPGYQNGRLNGDGPTMDKANESIMCTPA